MSSLRDTKTGRFKLVPFEEKYPTGRKHCAGCGRWRHILDFSVHTWLDASRTKPFKLLSYCHTCMALRQRERTGYARRNWYKLGRRGTEVERIRRNCERRARYLILRQDPVWVEQRRNYQRKHKRPDPEILTYSGCGEFDAQRFLDYLSPYMHVEYQGGLTTTISGKRLTNTEVRALHRWRSGESKSVRLTTADSWALRFDLPLWEIEEAASMAV